MCQQFAYNAHNIIHRDQPTTNIAFNIKIHLSVYTVNIGFCDQPQVTGFEVVKANGGRYIKWISGFRSLNPDWPLYP